MRSALVVIFLICSPLIAFGGVRERSLPLCGSIISGPIADPSDGGRRVCPVPGSRSYQRRNGGIGFEILDLEFVVCFVPDELYRLLDDIIDDVASRLPNMRRQTNSHPKIGEALAVSKATGDVLQSRGFALYIPTVTLGDALVPRNMPGEEPRHVFDCDTGSIILLTVAHKMALAASLVEITLPSGTGHNYVRWKIDEKEVVDWDTNGRAQCATPTGLPSFQGKSMSKDEIISYVLNLRAFQWKRRGMIDRALQDYREAIRKHPAHPEPLNNFAWLVASSDFPERNSYKIEAMDAAQKATLIQRSPSYLDTLACMHAFSGDYIQAAKYEKEASDGEPSNKVFADRLQKFRSATPQDCTGSD